MPSIENARKCRGPIPPSSSASRSVDLNRLSMCQPGKWPKCPSVLETRLSQSLFGRSLSERAPTGTLSSAACDELERLWFLHFGETEGGHSCCWEWSNSNGSNWVSKLRDEGHRQSSTGSDVINAMLPRRHCPKSTRKTKHINLRLLSLCACV